MSKKLILLFSHNLTKFQKKEANNSLEITEFVSLPISLQNKWSNVPAESDDISNYLTDIRLWLMEVANKNDYILIQGDFGATYFLVNLAFQFKLIPVYSTTERIHEEVLKQDGTLEMKKIFKHVKYRKYKNNSKY